MNSNQYSTPSVVITDKKTGTKYYGYRQDDGSIQYVTFVNGSKPEDVYAVTVNSRGIATDCECKSRQLKLKRQGKACKHMQAETARIKAVKAPTPVKPASKPAKIVDISTRGNLNTSKSNQGFSLLKRA